MVPACVDLRDFPFMPMEFGRLFSSDTWTLSNDAEKVAAITLWGKSWSQVPAGSLPADDRLLAAHSGAGPRWKRVKDMALRGWRQGGDGRLYHPVVCEKALEAWLEKLTQRLSSGAGNAKRWGIEFDPSDIEAQIIDARGMLAALNPQSKALAKRKPPGVPSGPKKPPAGNPRPVPPGVPSGSQETETGTGNKDQQLAIGKSTPASSPLPARDDSPSGVGDPPSVHAAIAANPALPAVVALRKRGGVWLRLTPTNPEILTAIREGVTLETIEALADAYPEKPPTYVIRAARRERADGAQPITGETHHARPREPRKSLADQTLEWAAEQQGHGVPLDPDDREVRAPVDLAVRRTSGGSGGG